MSNPFDEPTTIPGLRQNDQISLRMRHGNYKRDDLRAARGFVLTIIIGLAAIAFGWMLFRVFF